MKAKEQEKQKEGEPGPERELQKEKDRQRELEAIKKERQQAEKDVLEHQVGCRPPACHILLPAWSWLTRNATHLVTQPSLAFLARLTVPT